MNVSRYLAIAACSLALGACGGGGGGDGGGGNSPPLQYSGNTSAAVVTATNASAIVAAALGGSDVASATLNIASASQAEAGQGQLDIGRHLTRGIRASFVLPRDRARLTAVRIDQTDPCANGGSVRVFGDVSDFGIGTVNVTYSTCNVGGDVFTGQATMRIDAFDLGTFIPTDFTLSFGRLAIRGSVNSDIGGSVRVQTNLFTNTETVTENIVALYVGTGRMTRSVDLVFIDVYNSILSPASYTESVSGRVFDSVEGYVDIVTNTPLVFSTLAQAFPSSGDLVLTGASNRRIRLTAGSATVVDVALDLDSDGTFEIQTRLAWSALGTAAGTDLGDSDTDGMHNSWETAFNAPDPTADQDSDGFNNLAEYQAGTNPNVADATLPPPPNPGPLPPGPVMGMSIVLANASDIVYDSVTNRIYAAVRTNPGSVVPVHPTTGVQDTAIVVGSNPAKLARSDDGQYLYVALDGQADVQRINLATQAVDLTIPLGSGSFGPRFAEDIHVLPGNAGAFAVSLRNQGSSPRHEGVAIFDGATPRGQMTAGHTGSNRIEFSASSTTLYGYNNVTTEFGFRRMTVAAGGVTVTDVYDSFAPGGPLVTIGFGGDIKFGGGFIFTTNGQMIDPIARVQVAHPSGNPGPTFTLPGVFGHPAPDGALNRVFYLVNNGGTWNVKAFDMGSRLEIGNADIAGVTGTPGSLIRWGAKGLAFRTSDGQIFMVESTSWIP